MLIELIAFFVILVFWWALEDKKRYAKSPPGPARFPILGNLPQLATKSPFPAEAFVELSEKYGDVVSVQIGSLHAVAFTSLEGILEILHHDKVGTSRGGHLIPIIKDRKMDRNLGLIWGNDEEWQTIRRFTIRTLRDFGFGKTTNMDFVINEELDKLLAFINKVQKNTEDNLVRMDDLFDLSVINALWRLVTGVNYNLEDPKMLRLMRLSNEMVQSSSFAFDFSIAYPSLHPLFGRQRQLRIRDDLFEFCRETIQEHRSSKNYINDPQCFVDVFLTKIEENPESKEFNDDQLLLTILDLFQAGAETTSKSLGFAMLYMMLNPDVQKKVQDELDSVVPEGTPITMSLKNQLPYSFATTLEYQRMASVVPFPPLRVANEDFEFRNYTIKEGTALMLDIQAVHYDKKIWGDPEVFRPERFLTKDGTLDMKMADFILPFGGGRRKCLGIQLAETSLFLYFTTMLRNYTISRAPGHEEPSTVPIPGMTSTPRPYSAKLVKRTH